MMEDRETPAASGRILVAEDRDSLRRLLRRTLTAEGYDVRSVSDGGEAIELVEEEPFDLVLTDLRLPEASGLEVLAAVRTHLPQAAVVVLTGYGTVAEAVEAMKLGAHDFLEKPVEIAQLLELCQELIAGPGRDTGDEASPERPFEAPGAPAIVGRHPLLRGALRLLRRVAPTPSTVLLTGESGTGKELFARALHGLSPRRDEPFVAINCAALPEALIENELFGHEKGAFTGATRRQAGRFEQADGGTLFLDEIGELPLAVQGKVLRALEEKTFERIGGDGTLHADVRLVAATNRQLAAMVEEGTFRGDLYYRLEVFPIELPPLRLRMSDIPSLARHLLTALAPYSSTPLRLTTAAEDLLMEQRWPGNVRQLANVLERAVILSDGERIDAAELETCLRTTSRSSRPDTEDRSEEEQALRNALVAAEGDKQRAAELLGVSYRTVQRRIRRWDLEGFPQYRS